MTSKWKSQLKRALIEERQMLTGAAGVLEDKPAEQSKD